MKGFIKDEIPSRWDKVEMTHDELLAKIDETETVGWWSPIRFKRPTTSALRAVVELHKPIEEDGKLWCKHEVCYSHIEFLERTDCECNYPCPTIQTIEKELE